MLPLEFLSLGLFAIKYAILRPARLCAMTGEQNIVIRDEVDPQ